MKSTRSPFPTVMAAVLLVLSGFAAFGPVMYAQNSRPLTTADFKYSPQRGFGDRDNSWAQSMVWWKHHLYVGTGRASMCTSLFAIWRFADAILGQELADAFLPYPPKPPNDSDLSCPPDGADLRLQAEIWRWTPGGDRWDLAFRSPNDLDNPGPPPQPGKKLPYEITFRGMAAHTDPDGTEALYAFGVNSAVMWDNTKIPPPRILRTTDGETWTPLPQTPGTFLGDLPFNADHSSFRSPLSFKGKLLVLSGPIFGQGSLIGSENPAAGDDAWFLAAPANVLFYEMSAFNGWLYLGTFNPIGGGYSVIKTKAEGPPPYQFQTVIPVGAYHPDPVRASRSVVSMNEFQGRLYVGTASMTEVLRINPDDTWDLVVGPPRVAPSPAGGVEWKYPLSGLDNGFGHTPNDHAWQMGDLYRQLYVGTYNASVGARYDPVYGPKLAHNMGAHLYRTNEGWYYQAITTDGFANLGDPHGGKYDYGIRTMVPTPHGVFLGTANDYWGLTVFRANTAGTSTPPAPPRLEIEPVRSGGVLLSWQDTGQAKQYQVWRAERLPAFFRTELNFEAWNVISGNYIADTYVGPYEQIALTANPYFVDGTVQPGHQYMYYVVTVMTQNNLSDQSNLVGFPLLMPPMTFTMLEREIGKMALRGRLNGADALAKAQAMVAEARAAAAYCQLDVAQKALNPKKASTLALFPESVDVEVLTSKLVRRLQMYQVLPAEVISTEICVP